MAPDSAMSDAVKNAAGIACPGAVLRPRKHTILGTASAASKQRADQLDRWLVQPKQLEAWRHNATTHRLPVANKSRRNLPSNSKSDMDSAGSGARSSPDAGHLAATMTF